MNTHDYELRRMDNALLTKILTTYHLERVTVVYSLCFRYYCFHDFWVCKKPKTRTTTLTTERSLNKCSSIIGPIRVALDIVSRLLQDIKRVQKLLLKKEKVKKVVFLRINCT